MPTPAPNPTPAKTVEFGRLQLLYVIGLFRSRRHPGQLTPISAVYCSQRSSHYFAGQYHSHRYPGGGEGRVTGRRWDSNPQSRAYSARQRVNHSATPPPLQLPLRLRLRSSGSDMTWRKSSGPRCAGCRRWVSDFPFH